MKIILTVAITALIISVGLYMKEKSDSNQTSGEGNHIQTSEPNENDGASTETDNESEPESDTYTDIRISAAGDIMFHDTQLESAYDAKNDSYDFTSVFEDVKPIFTAADLAIANFETTTAGPNEGYRGYPTFNSPDETIDAIKAAGIDVLTTTNNHSLDTGTEGLKRTVEVIREKGLSSVGTYDEKPESRVLMQEVKGIKIAVIAYTEMINDIGLQTTTDDLSDMINLMEKDLILEDIAEAKELGADMIISYMHWGDEYVENPNAAQVDFAEMMAEEGVDIILGSHPHVIQKSEYLEVAGNQAFVIYSMGNFVSNQRMETIDNELTEDGVIVNFDIRKDEQTKETTVRNVEYVPTWVYRDQEAGQSTFTYRILPIEDFLTSSDISDTFKKRMEQSLDTTVSKMETKPSSKE